MMNEFSFRTLLLTNLPLNVYKSKFLFEEINIRKNCISFT